MLSSLSTAEHGMWRTWAILVLVLLLAGSVGGNALVYGQARAASADVDHQRARALAAEQGQNTLQKRVDQLTAQNQRLQAAAPAAPLPTVDAAGAAPMPLPPGFDQDLLLRMEGQVEVLRGLRVKSPVPLKLLDASGLHAYFVDNFNRDYPQEERDADQKLLTTLGLLSPNDDLVQIELDLLQEQVIGVYSENDKTMYLVGDPSHFGPDEKGTFVHEYAHALQDQYFDLATLSPKHPDNDDQAQAIQGLTEGDATLLQRLWSQANLTPGETAQLGQGGANPKLSQAPLVVREQLLFPYVEGFNFVHQVYQTGAGYASVNELFRKPPASTSQVLHPDKYLAGTRPVDVTLPDLAAAMGEGWRTIRSNVLGEFELRVVLEQFTDASRAARGTNGWAGDRWQLLEKDGKQALVMRSEWSSENAARTFFDTYGVALANRFGGAKREEASNTRQALTAATLATELRITGRDVLAVISFDRASAEALAAAAGS